MKLPRKSFFTWRRGEITGYAWGNLVNGAYVEHYQRRDGRHRVFGHVKRVAFDYDAVVDDFGSFVQVPA